MALTDVPVELSSTPSIVDGGNAAAITIDSSENVGIGTSATSAKVIIDRGAGSSSPTTFTTANSYLQLGGSDYNSSGSVYAIGLGYSGGATNSPAYLGFQLTSVGSYTKGDLVFRTRDSTDDVATTERMRITSAGALILDNAGSDAQMYFGGASGTSRMYLARSGTDSLLWNVDNGVMRFGTNNAERMRIAADGTATIGRTITTTYDNDQGYPLHIQSAGGSQTYLSISVPGANSGDTGLVIGHDQTGTRITNREADPMIFGISSTEKMRLDSSRLTLKDSGSVYDGGGTSNGTIHLNPNSSTDFAGNAVTFGASDSASGTTAVAGVYTRTDGTIGSELLLSTTDSYAYGSKVSLKIDHLGKVTLPRTRMVAGVPTAIIRGNGTWQALSSGWQDLDDVVGFTAYSQSSDSPFDPATGRFTAPVAGYYLCTASMYVYNPSGQTHSAQYIHPQWARNDNVSIMGQTPYQIFGHNEDTTNGTAFGEGVGRADVVKCDEDDYLTMRIFMQGSTSSVYGNYTMLTFTLLSAI